MLRDLGLGANLHFVDASSDFLSALAGLTEPEEKRAAIGKTFVDVFQREAQRLDIADHLLGQGTIYPDTIETGGTKRSHTIKTHHNRIPLIEEMIADGRVIEPLADLYKTEVRELGAQLGIPHHALWRHPFPGPGLGVRVLCNKQLQDTAPAQLQPKCDAIVQTFGLSARVLPIRSVGVKADLRSYEHPLLVRGEAEYARLFELASAVLKEVEGINRVIWQISPAAGAQGSPLAATMTQQRILTAQQADDEVMQALRQHELYDSIWQCPTVLVPVALDPERPSAELCVLRPVYSARAMTARPAELPLTLLQKLDAKLRALDGVSCVALDITSKPPGTIEWE